MIRIKRWQLGVIAFCMSSCQLISGLDDLEANGKNKSGIGTADAGDAGGSARDGGDDDSGAMPVVGGSVAVAGTAAEGGSGGMSGGAGIGGASGAAGAAPLECKRLDGICDPVSQCGCPNDGNCAFFEGKLACVGFGNAQPYSRCSGATDCTRGYQCVGGVCTKPCASVEDASCTADGGQCVQVEIQGKPVPGNFSCTRSCNPVNPQLKNDRFDGCGSGLGCTTIDGHTQCIQSKPSAAAGASCQRDEECAQGFYCSVSNVCEQWCEVAGNDCAPGSKCAGFANKEFAGKGMNKAELGVCCTPPAGRGPCDTSPQCGCAADQRCDFVFSNGMADGTTACIPVGNVQPYGACPSQASCGKGFSCTDKACRQLCDLTRLNSCASYSEFSHCLPVQVQGKDVQGWGVCSQVCNPAAPFKDGDARFTPCVTGTSCKHLGNGETNCLPLASGAREGKTGDSCASSNGMADGTLCAPGYFCDFGSLECVQYCEVDGMPSGCAQGETCIAFSPAVKVAKMTLGYCQQ